MKKIALPFLCLLAFQSKAQDINISGFASAHVTNSFAGSRTSTGRVTPDNYSRSVDYQTFSKFGLNISSELSPNWKIQSQVLVAGNKQSPGSSDPQWGMYANWLFLSYQMGENTRVRLGRQLFAAWLVSEVIDVGFMYPWVETPHAVYELAPFKSLNGISIDHTFKLEDSQSIKVMAFGGSESLTVPVEGDAANEKNTYSDIVGSEVSLQGKGYKLRAMGSYYQVDGNVSDNSTTLVGPYSSNSVKTYTVGYRYDLNNVLVLAEYGYRRGAAGTKLTNATSQGIVPVGTTRNYSDLASAGYVTFGYWFGKFLPHLTLSNSNWKTGTVEGKQSLISLAGNYKVLDNLMFKSNFSYANSKDGQTHLSGIGHSYTVSAGVDLIF